jgi:hypothetical protein
MKLILFTSLLITTTSYNMNSTISPADEYQMQMGLVNYGNWCGPGHGGYQDCCNGNPCPSCNVKDGPPTEACLKECPAVDQLDYQCSFHDECCINNEKQISCSPEGNYCACDCLLLEGSNSVTDCTSLSCKSYRASLDTLFSYSLSCWYYDQNHKETCNTLGSRKYSVNEFCNNNHSCDPWNPNC